MVQFYLIAAALVSLRNIFEISYLFYRYRRVIKLLFTFKNLFPAKKDVIFTWDDNSNSHEKIIAPIFIDRGYRCTFYINPGESAFETNYLDSYKRLSMQGFEIGSHGYVHQHLSYLSGREFIIQMTCAQSYIEHNFQRYPTTFAFPHHDYDEFMLSQARELYFETRNTLYHSRRFSLKTNTILSSVDEALYESESSGYSIVFSGHGSFLGNEPQDLLEYESISDRKIEAILDLVKKHTDLQVCTLEQAAVKSFLLLYGSLDGCTININESYISGLYRYGLTPIRIAQLI